MAQNSAGCDPWAAKKARRLDRGLDTALPQLADPQIPGRLFAAVADDLVTDLCALSEPAKTGPLNRRDVYENVFSAGVRLNKPVTLSRVEPFHSTCRHVHTPFLEQ
jgi:hypothetical protein